MKETSGVWRTRGFEAFHGRRRKFYTSESFELPPGAAVTRIGWDAELATRVLHQVEGKVTGDFAMPQLCLELGPNPNWRTIFSEAPTKKQPMKSVMTVASITTTLIRSRRTGTTTGVGVLFSMRPGMVDD